MMDERDLVFDSYTNSSSEVRMRITHIPTGLSVNGQTTKSRYKLREQLLKELEIQVKQTIRSK